MRTTRQGSCWHQIFSHSQYTSSVRSSYPSSGSSRSLSCVSCYYYGKTCAFGRGRVCCALFRKGNPEEFTGMSIRWYDLLPDFLVFIVPIVVGLWLLMVHFDVILLAVIILLFVLGTFGNGMVRGQFTCKYCKQRELRCPAEKLFAKKEC
jgi:hypothetical protein